MPRAAAALCLLALSAGQARSQDLVIDRWLIRGPIPTDTGATRVLADYLDGEAAALPTVGDAGWQPVRADDFGKVNLREAYAPDGVAWTVAYAHTYVHAPDERVVLLVADSDDDLAVWLNGERAWLNEIARGLGSGRDTAVVRLSPGWNSLLFKVLNQSGDFGFLGRLAPGDDLRLALERPRGMARHNRPAPTVTVGPLLVDAVRWRGGDLWADVRAPVAAWGADTLRSVRVTLAELASDSFPAIAVGEPAELATAVSFARLRDAALDRAPLVAEAAWATAPMSDGDDVGAWRGPVAAYPDRVLRLAGGRIAIDSFRVDSAAGQPGWLEAKLAVPAAFDGLSLDLLTRGMGPRARYIVNARQREWDDGAVELCAPCRAGDSLGIDIVPEAGRPLWELPVARVREAGYREYADGYEFAIQLAGRAPAIQWPDPADWLAALGERDAYAELTARYREAFTPLAAEIRRDTLHLIGNSHIDAAWLWPWSETIEVIRDTWRTSLKLREIFPGYVFAASSAAYYDMLDRLYPQLADSIVAAAEEGWWVPVGGWWVESDMNLPSGESLVRQGLYGQRYFERRFGERSRVAWTPDVFGYAWTVPQILKGQGFEYFVTQKMRWNDSTEFPHNAFYWEGLDGTRILTYNPYGYVHELDPGRLVSQRLEDRRRTGSNHQIVLYGVGDHGGGPTIEMLERAEDLRRVPTFPVMRYAKPYEALEKIAADPGPGALPVWDDELYLEYHRGTYTTQAFIKWMNRRSEAWLRKAEALAVASSRPYPRAELERAWRNVLFNQFHDILPGSSIPEVYDDAQAVYGDAMTLIFDTVIAPSFDDVRARMDTRGDGQAVVVFNSLGWPRDGWLHLSDRDGRRRRISVSDVPAYGARVIHLPRDSMSAGERELPPPTAGPNWIENAFLRVEVDTLTGEIVRLYDRTNGREVLAPGGRGNVLQIFDDRPEAWDAWNIVSWGDRSDVTAVRAVSVSAGGREAEMRIERRWGASTFIQTLSLARDSRHLEISNDIDWHEEHKLLKVAFPLAVTADSATYEIPYGAIGRSGRPRTARERAKFEVSGQRWADVSADGYGVSILNDGKYGWDYRDNVLRLSLLRSPTWPDSLADREWHSFRFAIYPHTGDWRDAETVKRAAEYNTMLHWGTERPHRGPLGRSFSLASLAPGNVHITALKRAEETDALVLRLVEWHGQATDAEVTLDCPIATARRANLIEDPGPVIESEGKAARLSLRPHEIATLLIECEERE